MVRGQGFPKVEGVGLPRWPAADPPSALARRPFPSPLSLASRPSNPGNRVPVPSVDFRQWFSRVFTGSSCSAGYVGICSDGTLSLFRNIF